MEAASESRETILHQGLARIRRRRWFLWTLIILYLPAMMAAMRAPNAEQMIITAFSIWLVLLIIAVALLALARCPQCGECFHMNGYSFRPVRKCFHCGLPLTADKRSHPHK